MFLPYGSLELSRNLRLVLKFTFPDREDSPAQLLQGGSGPSVALNISVKLGEPKVRPRLRENRIVTTLVRMPETSVDEDHNTAAWKNNVRFARKIASS